MCGFFYFYPSAAVVKWLKDLQVPREITPKCIRDNQNTVRNS